MFKKRRAPQQPPPPSVHVENLEGNAMDRSNSLVTPTRIGKSRSMRFLRHRRKQRQTVEDYYFNETEAQLEDDPTAITDPDINALKSFKSTNINPEAAWFGNEAQPFSSEVSQAETDTLSVTPPVSRLVERTDTQRTAASFNPAASTLSRRVSNTRSFSAGSETASLHAHTSVHAGPAEEDLCVHNFRHTDTRFYSPSLKSNRSQRNGATSAESAVQLGLHIIIRGAEGLMAADSNGTSDPFVIIRLGKHKEQTKVIKKTTEPDWNQDFFIPLTSESPTVLELEVYDKDTLSQDYLGSVRYDFSQLVVNKAQPVTVALKDHGKSKKPLPNNNLGYIDFELTKMPMNSNLLGSSRLGESNNEAGSRLVTVDVIEAWDLQPWDDNGLADPYVRLSIRKQKRKSKVCNKTLHPVWKQRFEFAVHDATSNLLKIELYDRDPGMSDELMGHCEIDLTKLSMDHTHSLKKSLGKPEDGEIYLQVTVTDFFARKALTGLKDLAPAEAAQYVGMLKVYIHMARGLAARDMGGTSDPFVVCELGNSRQRTRTIQKNVNPVWNDTLQFYVRDIFDVLRVTIYDEDKGDKKEFIGALIIPLLEIRNGVRDYWPLKTASLTGRAKGKIQLSMDLQFDALRAYSRVIKPVEERNMDEEPKFKLPIFKNNIRRFTSVIKMVVGGVGVVDKMFKWEYGIGFTLCSIVFWVWMTLFLQVYHVPLLVALRLGYNWFTDPAARSLVSSKDELESYDEYASDEDDESDEEDTKGSKKSKQGIRERVRAIHSVGQNVQNKIGEVASLGEKFKNLCNWSIPAMTAMIVGAMLVASIVLFFCSIRYLLLIGGLKRFFDCGVRKYVTERRMRRSRSGQSGPTKPKSNPALAILRRVPDDIEKMQRRKLKMPNTKERGSRPSMARRQTLEASQRDDMGDIQEDFD
ncbi:uncharacterized protein MONBRDRAFT_34172 [Monosiga brevicollis MX1]|uniref:C2 domain-containing protein n=1 Tax=Monosiga brevicollis TaxID=81824 RepID=A9VA04_MONBE|nr:uncharacterized protein MONBRDRAFT_34172 [Monosiga brevicollis MX1]EDQ85579.1 predicted protein [Monosiga brevicollis MX1]|eukprot:XP_001749528.1 hypothetical protein [Monosiga brevicollis MX1]